MAETTKKRCDKAAYANAEQARAAIAIIRLHSGLSRQLKVYQCHSCRLWHLSSSDFDGDD